MTTIAPPIWLRITPFDYRRALAIATPSHTNTGSHVIDWDDPEIHATLVRLYEAGQSSAVIGERFGRSESAIGRRIRRMVRDGSIRPRLDPNTYTPQDICYLRKYYPTKGPQWCATHLGRSIKATYEKARCLSLQTPDVTKIDRAEVVRWMKAYMRERGLTCVDSGGVVACAHDFRCSVTTIKYIRREYDLQPYRRKKAGRRYTLDKLSKSA